MLSDNAAEFNRIVLGRYQILNELGRGAFATVYRVYDTFLNRQVALKTISARNYPNPQKFLQNFEQETQILASIKHPNIIEIYDSHIDEVALEGYVVMPIAEGGTLSDVLKQHAGGLSLKEAKDFFLQITAGVNFAHLSGIIHRDLKPQNILFSQGRLLITDFGLAKVLGPYHTHVNTAAIGTYTYMAPEQFEERAGQPSDIYALGIIFYEMLAGQPPFSGSGAWLMNQHLTRPLPNLLIHRPDLPVGLQGFLAQLTAKSEQYRPLPHDIPSLLEITLTEPLPGKATNPATYSYPPFSPVPSPPVISGGQVPYPTPILSDANKVVASESKGSWVKGKQWIGLIAAMIALVAFGGLVLFVNTSIKPIPLEVNVGQRPVGIAFDGTNIWIANFSSANIMKIRASDGKLIDTLPVGSNPGRIAFDGTNIWVGNNADHTVSKIRAVDGAIQGTFPVNGLNPEGLAFDGANIWVANYTSNNVTKLRASDGRLLGSFKVGNNPRDILFDGTNIWVTNQESNNLTKLRPSDGMVEGIFTVNNGPFGLAFDGANLWITSGKGSTVTKLRVSDGTNLGTFTVGNNPQGVTYAEGIIWVANSTSRTVTKLRASDGTFLETIAVGATPFNIAVTGNSIWVTNYGSNTVSRRPR